MPVIPCAYRALYWLWNEGDRREPGFLEENVSNGFTINNRINTD